MAAGLTSSQVDDFSCTDFNLLVPTKCTCTVKGSILVLEVMANLTVLGLMNLKSKDLNMPTSLVGLPDFSVLLTDSSNGTLTATVNFTTLSDYQGYTITCATTGESSLQVSINISGTG